MRFSYPTLVACLAVATTVAGAQVGDSSSTHGLNLSYMDRKVSPIDDFFRYTNGSWIDATLIPQNRTIISANSQAIARSAHIVQRLIEMAVEDRTAARGTAEQIVGEFCRVAMDRSLAEQVGIKPLQGELDRINRIETRRDVMYEIGRLHRWLISPAFSVRPQFDPLDSGHKILFLWQAGLSLGQGESYLQNDPKAGDLRQELARSMRRTFRLLGDYSDVARESANAVLALETDLAAAWRPSTESDISNVAERRMSPSDLEALIPKIDWKRYFDGLGMASPKIVAMGQTKYFVELGNLLDSKPISDWKSYLRWQLVSSMSPYLSESYVQASFALHSALTGQEMSDSSGERVLAAADQTLRRELDQLYARYYSSSDARSKVESMIRNIRTALRDQISRSEWMSSTAKLKALEKLRRMGVCIGYPDHEDTFQGLIIDSSSFAENVLRAREYHFQKDLDSLDQPADRGEWEISAYAVNAYYSSSLNTVVLPAALLQAPYFDPQADNASNYGSLGVVIGHEIMHGFDDQGRKFDADGNMNSWWDKSDEARFAKVENQMVDQFDAYRLSPSLKVDGRKTLAENVADLGGIEIAYSAFQRAEAQEPTTSKSGLTPDQRFFIAFGQVFRSKIRPESERLFLETNPHSPPRFRVNGALQNSPEFWKAFGSEPPKNFVHIW